MSILQNAAHVGVQVIDARPGVFSFERVFQDLVSDQAQLYESIANLKAPNSAAIVATPHVHDGVNGAQISIPLAQQYLRGCSLRRRSSQPTSGGADHAFWSPYVWLPYFVPTGITALTVGVVVNPPETADSLRVTNSSNGVTVERGQFGSDDPADPMYWLRANRDGRATYSWRLPVSAGVNLIKFEAWDGFYDQHTEPNEVGSPLPASRFVDSFFVLPMLTPPVAVRPTRGVGFTTTKVHVPPDLVTFDSTQVADDEALSSFEIVSAIKNDALLFEMLTDQPAGNRLTTTVRGHNHKDDAATDLDDAGADMDQCLGAWFYGTMRRPVGDAALADEHPPYDTIGATDQFQNNWDGGINGLTLVATVAAGAFRKFAEHRFRIPAAIAANLAAGTGKVKAAAFVYNDNAETFIRVTVLDRTLATAGATTTFSTTSAGRQVFQSLPLDLSTVGDEEEAVLRVELAFTTPGKVGDGGGVYGLCLFYQES